MKNNPELKRWVSVLTLNDRGEPIVSDDFPIHKLEGREAENQILELKKFLIEVLVPLCTGPYIGEVAKIRVTDL